MVPFATAGEHYTQQFTAPHCCCLFYSLYGLSIFRVYSLSVIVDCVYVRACACLCTCMYM